MSSLLLDTHALLWSLGEVEQLSDAAHEVLTASTTAVYVSAASVWEMSIKRRSGKLTVPDDLLERIVEARFEELQISRAHAMLAGELPLHHRDPFDRMLVAQAQCEGLTIVTCDERIAAYGVPTLW